MARSQLTRILPKIVSLYLLLLSLDMESNDSYLADFWGYILQIIFLSFFYAFKVYVESGGSSKK